MKIYGTSLVTKQRIKKKLILHEDRLIRNLWDGTRDLLRREDDFLCVA